MPDLARVKFVFLLLAYNINYGLPQPLLAKCRYLREYSTLVYKVKEGIRAGRARKETIRHAVKFCLDNRLMKGYLEFNSQEVFNMLALQWEHDKAIRASYEDGVESVAINFINMGMTSKKVQEAMRLSIEYIKELTTNPNKYKIEISNH